VVTVTRAPTILSSSRSEKSSLVSVVAVAEVISPVRDMNPAAAIFDLKEFRVSVGWSAMNLYTFGPLTMETLSLVASSGLKTKYPASTC